MVEEEGDMVVEEEGSPNNMRGEEEQNLTVYSTTMIEKEDNNRLSFGVKNNKTSKSSR